MISIQLNKPQMHTINDKNPSISLAYELVKTLEWYYVVSVKLYKIMLTNGNLLK